MGRYGGPWRPVVAVPVAALGRRPWPRTCRGAVSHIAATALGRGRRGAFRGATGRVGSRVPGPRRLWRGRPCFKTLRLPWRKKSRPVRFPGRSAFARACVIPAAWRRAGGLPHCRGGACCMAVSAAEPPFPWGPARRRFRDRRFPGGRLRGLGRLAAFPPRPSLYEARCVRPEPAALPDLPESPQQRPAPPWPRCRNAGGKSNTFPYGGLYLALGKFYSGSNIGTITRKIIPILDQYRLNFFGNCSYNRPA